MLSDLLGLAGMAPGPNTSKPHPEHKIYPYLLRGVDVTKPNQVRSLCVNIDVASNKEVNYGVFKSSDVRSAKKSLAA